MYLRVGKDARYGSCIVDLSKQLISEFVSYMRKYPSLYQQLSKRVVECVPDNVSQPCIVDIGCGPGFLLQEVGSLCPQSILIGVDNSSEMLSYAREQLSKPEMGNDVCLLRSSVESLPIVSQQAHVVASRFSLPYWPDPHKGFLEIYRILTTGGYLVLDALNPDFSRVRLWAASKHMKFNQASSHVIKYHKDSFDCAYKSENIYEMLLETGFTPLRTRTVSYGWHYEIIASKDTK